MEKHQDFIEGDGWLHSRDLWAIITNGTLKIITEIKYFQVVSSRINCPWENRKYLFENGRGKLKFWLRRFSSELFSCYYST